LIINRNQKKIIIGGPQDKNTFRGPVARSEHRDRVENHIISGFEQGAKQISRGEKLRSPSLSKGFYVLTAVFKDVTLNMRIVREEIFSPVAEIY
jgi:acyl-CoA reductase-like NAD-dependent aldehyde dehydrogenase